MKVCNKTLFDLPLSNCINYQLVKETCSALTFWIITIFSCEENIYISLITKKNCRSNADPEYGQKFVPPKETQAEAQRFQGLEQKQYLYTGDFMKKVLLATWTLSDR